MNKRTTIPAPVGGSSLLVIFAVLCFAVFSMLVLATVKADERLANASHTAVSDYYAADVEAERMLGQLRSGIVEEGVTQDGNYYTYECKVNDTQCLHVEVEVVNTDYTVYEWKLRETTEWKPDQNLDLMEIEDF